MARERLPRPLTLADVFAKVPEIADLVVKELDPADAEDLMTKTDPALTAFCQGVGGGFGRYLKISREGKHERKRLRRLPSLPRLLVEEWQDELLGNRLVAENVQGDNTVGLLLSWPILFALFALSPKYLQVLSNMLSLRLYYNKDIQTL